MLHEQDTVFDHVVPELVSSLFLNCLTFARLQAIAPSLSLGGVGIFDVIWVRL